MHASSNVLIVGGGGREHALAWKAAQSPRVENVYVAPGNVGSAREPKVTVMDIAAHDGAALIACAQEKNIGLCIPGPETVLAAGFSDQCKARGIRCFGPSQAATRLESSKTFAKAFMARHRVPCAAWRKFELEDAALAYIRQRGAPVVIKADGLAAGKGVVVAQTAEQAESAVHMMLGEQRFGEAGSRIVMEEFLEGEELSIICMVEGGAVLPLAVSQDHKPRDDGDRGPNTGGMGAYSPAPLFDAALEQRVMREIVLPTVNGLVADGAHYTGFLYIGLMVDAAGNPRVLEYNCRLGDPETQPILMRLRSDLVRMCDMALAGRLGEVTAEWDARAALGVVLAAAGYPGPCTAGDPIGGLDDADDDTCKVFHAGTRIADGEVVTAGGRVLCVTTLGDDVAAARACAYQKVAGIQWPGMFCRNDIGHHAIEREKTT